MQLIVVVLCCASVWTTVTIWPVHGQTAAPAVFPAGCNGSLSQGLRDDLFTASSTRGTGNLARDAKTDRGGWVAGGSGEGEYLQLNFEQTVKITGLRLTATNIGWYTRAVRISHSLDGLVWTAYNSRLADDLFGQVFREQTSRLIEIVLDPPIQAQYLVVNPSSWYGYPCMRLDVLGCSVPGAPTPPAGTRIESNIETDAVWIPGQSPIVIASQLAVAPGATLTVQAGVTVVFTAHDAGLNVYGRLETEGIAGLEVVFTSSHPVLSVRERWRGLKQVSGGNVRLAHSVVRQAVTGLQGNGSRMSLEHGLIHSCTHAAMLSSGTDVPAVDNFTIAMLEPIAVFSDTVFLHNQYGVKLHGLNNKQLFVFIRNTFSFCYHGVTIENWDRVDSTVIESMVVFSQSNLSDNTHSGVYSAESSPASLTFLNTTVSRNKEFGLYTYRWYANSAVANVSLINSSFTDNKRDIYLYCYNCQSVAYSIHNCSFVRSNVYIYFTPYYNSPSSSGLLSVANSTFIESSKLVPLTIYMSASHGMVIYSNTFKATYGCIDLNWDTGSTEVLASISQNQFLDIHGESVLHMRADNLKLYFMANKVYNSTPADLIDVEKGFIFMSANNFSSNVQHTCYVKTSVAYDNETVLSASNNYWGTDDVAVIKAKMCDFFLDSTKIRIQIHSIFNSPAMTDVVDTRSYDDFKYVFDFNEKVFIIGGEVTADVTVDESVFAYPVVVNRSIVIQHGVTVTLAGIEVGFAENRGVAVHGRLRVGESSGRETTIRALANSKQWNGLQLFSPDTIIQNAQINGSKTLLTYRTSVNATISNSTIRQTNNLISAEKHIGNVNITITQCDLDVTMYLMYILFDDTINADISVVNSTIKCNSRQCVYFKENVAQKSTTEVALRVRGSSITCVDGSSCIDVSSCNSHLVVDFLDTVISTKARAFSLQTLENNFMLRQSTIKDHSYGLYLQFCSGQGQKNKTTGMLELVGNTFYTTQAGVDIYMYQWYTYELQHSIHVLNNTFTDLSSSRRRCIQIYTQRYTSVSDAHTFFIKHNIFSNYSSAFSVEKIAKLISFENNTCENGGECVSADFRGVDFGNFSIHNSTVRGCRSGTGVVRLLMPYTGNATVNITDNWFVNNSEVMITFDSPMILLKRNFFENANAQYIVKVIQSSTSYAGAVVNASMNFWGTADVGAISTAIYDKDYDATLLDVVFRPYLGSKNSSDVRNEDVAFIRASGDIGGAVGGNVTLALDGSPYHVISNIDIQPNDTLTIEAGVIVLFDANLGINVQGKLNVAGTESKPVIMNAYIPENAWKGLDIQGNITCSLTNLIVNDTMNGVSVEGYQTSLINVTSNFSDSHGFSLEIRFLPPDHPEPTYRGLYAHNNSKSGIAVAPQAGPIRVLGCAATGNREHGWRIEADGHVSISGCTISENGQHGLYAQQGQGGRTSVQASRFESNTDKAAYVYNTEGFLLNSSIVINHARRYYYTSSAYIHFENYRFNSNRQYLNISNSHFINNSADGIACISGISVDINNNTFSGGNKIINFRMNYYYSGKILLRLADNTISRNSMKDGVMIDINTYYAEAVINVTNNVFDNNYAARVFAIDAYDRERLQEVNMENNRYVSNSITDALLDISSYPHVYVHGNVFNNLLDSCELRAPLMKNSSYHLNATHNYWGTRRLSSVIERVCGFDREMDRSFVYYLPYFVDETLGRVEALAHNVFDYAEGRGGEISRDLVITETTLSSRTVLVSRSIMIRDGSRLTVQEGMSLSFEAGRGIYVEGGLSLLGGAKAVNLTNNGDNWFGIVVSSKTDLTMISNTLIQNTRSGISVWTSLFDIRESVIQNSSATCLTMRLGPDRIYDFQGTLLYNCSKSGIELTESGNMTIVNASVHTASSGILLQSQYGQVTVRSSRLTNISGSALTVTYTDSGRSGNVTVENCIISNASRGIAVSVANYRTQNSIKINRNAFRNISTHTVDIRFPTYSYYSYGDEVRTVDVGYNTFHNSCYVLITSNDRVNISFHDNEVYNSSCVDSKVVTHFLDVVTEASRHLPHRLVDVSSNVFHNVSATYVIRLKGSSDDPLFNGSFNFNQFLDNRATESVLLLDTGHVHMSQNIFDSPNSLFDVYVVEKGNGTINASSNWWGSASVDHAFSRIFDGRQQYDLLTLNIIPVLTERAIDCSGVSNCSSQGDCISNNRCRCHSGWQGETCSDFDCAGVNDCYNNGVCVGPNQCQCNAGWGGRLCIDASCSNVGKCSGHGICVRPDECRCADRFTGADCGSCEEQHWGPLCQPCPACLHGNCDLNTGTCVCEGSNWAGRLCDICSDTFYGPSCLPLMMVLLVLPSEGRDTGGNLVHVWGHNFPQPADGANYTCRFGTDIVNGTWKAWNHVTCLAPQHSEGDVILEISTDGVTYTNNKLVYTFYATCPPGSCGKTLTPPHGQCLFGGCSCNLPWVGENCETELLAPVIVQPEARQTLAESSSYSLPLHLLQGDAPVRWRLIQGPEGMTINERTTTVEWPFAFARTTPYTIRVEARNIVGSHSTEWQVSVALSYVASVTAVSPSGVLPYAKPVRITGEVSFTNTSVARVVPVDVIVTNDLTGARVLQGLTEPLTPTTFAVVFNPRPGDAGTFRVFAKHPAADDPVDDAVSWRVTGMRCEPGTVSVSGLIDGDVFVHENISSLINSGGIVVDTVSAQVDGLPGTYVRRHGSTTHEQPFLTRLTEGGRQAFDLVVDNPRPLSGTVYIIFTSAEGLSTRVRVYVQLSIRKPLLVFTPSSLTENINRGSQKMIEVGVSNEGEVTARNVVADIPRDQRISLVAFALVNSTTETDAGAPVAGLSIPTNGQAVLTLAVTVGPEEPLGEMSGRIAINTNLTTGYIAYTFYITSLQTLTLNVTVTDEYSYFASGNPKVAGARVLLQNPRRGYNEERFTTNTTGSVQFAGIHEDRYTLYVAAENHAAYSAVIVAAPGSGSHVEAFLKRTAVTYEWTVTPTTVQDMYVLTMEATFETFVPMPVVTIEPAKVNTIPYELGQQDTMEFTITNHGLIRADNIRFALPKSHPYLIFESTIDTIGDLDANTSIVVPVRAKLRPRVKRNAVAMAICGLAMLYDLYCGGLQTYNRDVTLTREYPGRPPLPCGLVGSSSTDGIGPVGGVSYSGSSRGDSSGTVLNYNPITPLSCDCAKTLIKSCALAYHPIAGCAFAVADVGTSFTKKRTDGSLILGTLNLILGLADTAFACVFGFVCQLCGLFYTTVRCMIDVHYNCGGSRRRREISTDVVNNLLNVAQPMDNFLHIMEEILGDDNMYNIGREWYGSFKESVADDSEQGSLLSTSEESYIVSNLADPQNGHTLSTFLKRWNNTAAAWNNGTLTELADTSGVINFSRLDPRIEQYIADIEAAKEKGFDSIFDEYDNALGAYHTAEQQSKQTGGKDDNSVCAKVRVRIVQELVLTRDAFSARLEIENGESSALEDIRVDIQIRQTYGSGELANDKFSIGAPVLVGLTGVDGTGRLAQDLSGTAEWLIIPYSSAAPTQDILYDIGGRLAYRVGGSDFSVPLLPDTLTVKSNPSLVVHYFHEKFVRGDDPLTQEVEPVIPFSLCVLVMNAGYGVANALKITSGQPEIIENEKGLLVSFKIIGAQLGASPISPTLTVDFGDIMAFETKTARWLLTSTFKGTFYNYSATFENINPLGDPQLSLLDELGYHELIHLVRIVDSSDDLDDFLVNDVTDNDGMPDRLYSSANGTDVHDVSTANVTQISAFSFVRSISKNYTVIQLDVTVQNRSTYHYARIENNITSPLPSAGQYLIQAGREDGKSLLVDKNVWQTTHILDKFLVHVFDGNMSDSKEVRHVMYNLTYGPRNMYPPTFNTSSYSATIPKDSKAGTYVLSLQAYDIDKDAFYFALVNDSSQIFKIDRQTGVVILNENISVPSTYIFEVMVVDEGIPSKSSVVTVSVSIAGEGTTTVTTSSTTMSPSSSSASTSQASSSTTANPTPSSSTTTETSSSIPESTTTKVTTLPSPATSSSTTTAIVSTINGTTSTTLSSTSSSTSRTTWVSTTQSSTTSVNHSDSTTTSGGSSLFTTTAASTTTATSSSSSTTRTTSSSSDSPTSSNFSSVTSTIPSVSTGISVSTTVNVTVEERQELPQWVIPTAVGGGVLFVLVIIVVIFVYLVRTKADTGSRNYNLG